MEMTMAYVIEVTHYMIDTLDILQHCRLCFARLLHFFKYDWLSSKTL